MDGPKKLEDSREMRSPTEAVSLEILISPSWFRIMAVLTSGSAPISSRT